MALAGSTKQNKLKTETAPPTLSSRNARPDDDQKLQHSEKQHQMNIFNFFKKKRDEDIFERFRTAVFDLQAEIDHAFNGDMFSLDLLQRGIAQIQAMSVAMREIKFAPEINIYMEGLLTLI
jgi:hypothetical protein